MGNYKKLAIFDLDGTALDTLDDLANACNDALKVNGFTLHENEKYRYFVGDGADQLMLRILPEQAAHDAATVARVKAAFAAQYAAHSGECTRPYDGILPLLDALLAQGTRLAVLSNKPHAFVPALVKKYFGERFDYAHGQREGYPRKPDPSLVAELLELTGVAAKDCIYCGDSGVDMRTAKNAGVLAVGVLWGFRGEQELRECGADRLAARPEEILNFSRNDA